MTVLRLRETQPVFSSNYISSKSANLIHVQRRYLLLIGTLIVALPLSKFALLELCPRYEIWTQDGVTVPDTARHIQCWNSPWYLFPDRSSAAIFELPSNDVPHFVNQLKVRKKYSAIVTRGDPLGPSVRYFPVASTFFAFFPSGEPRFKRTWSGGAVPVAMFSCVSTKGDWLHVELWRTAGGSLIKLYTDRN